MLIDDDDDENIICLCRLFPARTKAVTDDEGGFIVNYSMDFVSKVLQYFV